MENHHWRSAIGCLLESGVYEQLSPDLRPELQQYISSLILATDITRQHEFLSRFKSYQDSNILDMHLPEYRHFILQIALKCADISNPCRPWDISRKWSYKVCEEFFRQGDYERQLSLPVTPLCDRQSISIPKIQAGFFQFVVTPLYLEWHRFLGPGLAITLMTHLKANQKRWETLINQEQADELKPEALELDTIEISPSSDEEITQERADSSSCDLLLLELPPLRVTAPSRRHSVPMSVAQPSSLHPHRSRRRESVPGDQIHFKTPLIIEDNLKNISSMSLLSSRSSLIESITNTSTNERPVSAENLLPETSIASITSSAEASRLSSVLQPDGVKQSKQLTRQQTFPPLQPYARIRYMSTTVEMSKCRTETLMEADSPPSSLSPSPAPPENSRRDRKISTRSYTISEQSRRRESATADFNRLNVESSFANEQKRRHSVQVMKVDEPLGKFVKCKRPSSAQEADQAEIFYANLTGGSRSESERQWSVGETDTESQGVYDECSPLPEGVTKPKDGELRRYSTPAGDGRSQVGEAGARRFTTIPVTTDLKVFFIGSPPESPPRHKSSSSSDSGSEASRHKSSKILKLSDEGRMKENVDPRAADDLGKSGGSRRTSQGWARRRGSAPVALMARIEDSGGRMAGVRRGSVPADISERGELMDFFFFFPINKYCCDYDCEQRPKGLILIIIYYKAIAGGSLRSALGPREGNLPTPRRASLPQEAALTNVLGTTGK